jgi:uncharacterized cupredoxin-like copper-binding protein
MVKRAKAIVFHAAASSLSSAQSFREETFVMRKNLVASLLPLVLGGQVAIVQAAGTSVVQIELRDSSTDPAISGMQMKADPTTVKAGRITFNAVNQSKELVHEVLVVPAPAGSKEIPYDAKSDRIIESRAHSRGEISDLKPGAKGSVTLSLKPGAYFLLCNQPGHYKAGMSTKLTVEK